MVNDADSWAIIPSVSIEDSKIVAPAPSAYIIESLSNLSTTLERVSEPITKHFFAIPDLMKLLAWIIPSTHPGQPNKISYATHLGFLIFKRCFTLAAKHGSMSL